MSGKLIAFVVSSFATAATANPFQWTVDSSQSVLTTTISATLGSTISDSETNHIAGYVGGLLRLPSYTFGTIHLTEADLGYTTNPSFSLTQPFLGGVTIVGSGLGFVIPGPNGLGFASPTPAEVDLGGAFLQSGNGAEGRGTLAYTGVGILGAGVGSGVINLLDQSPLPMDLGGVITQSGNQLLLTLPVSLDQTTVQNGIPVRVQINGNVYATSTTTGNGWKADIDGDWNTQANWVAGNGVPGAPGSTFDTAVFGDFLAGSQRTIGVTAAVAPRRLLVDPGNGGGYRFTGTDSISLAAGADASISVLSGVARFENPVSLPANAALSAEAGSSLEFGLLQSASGSVTHKSGLGTLHVQAADIGTFAIDAGSVAFHSASAEARAASLQIDPSASVSVADSLILESQPGGVAQVTSFLAASSGGATGGILPSPLGALGVGTKASTGLSTLGSFTLTETSIIVRLTIAGDTDLDRIVDFDDLLVLAQSYGSPGFWFDGDFDYDGSVDFDDLLSLAQNYGGSLSHRQWDQLEPDFASDVALARSLVPEPTIGLVSLMAMRRRRRRAID